MSDSRNLNDKERSDLKVSFDFAVTMVHGLLGTAAFRVLDKTGEPAESVVYRALLEAQLLACSWIDRRKGPDAQRARREIAGLFRDEGFMDSIQRATGDRSRTLKRVRDIVAALQRAGATVRVPHDLNT